MGKRKCFCNWMTVSVVGTVGVFILKTTEKQMNRFKLNQHNIWVSVQPWINLICRTLGFHNFYWLFKNTSSTAQVVQRWSLLENCENNSYGFHKTFYHLPGRAEQIHEKSIVFGPGTSWIRSRCAEHHDEMLNRVSPENVYPSANCTTKMNIINADNGNILEYSAV
jgi:hypothetical protein